MLLSTKRNQNCFIKTGIRCFGKPGQEPTVIPDKRGQTILEKMVEDGQEFIMGPPKSLNKTWNAPRTAMIDKLAPHMDVYA